jgi:hypothetical protein
VCYGFHVRTSWRQRKRPTPTGEKSVVIIRCRIFSGVGLFIKMLVCLVSQRVRLESDITHLRNKINE